MMTVSVTSYYEYATSRYYTDAFRAGRIYVVRDKVAAAIVRDGAGSVVARAPATLNRGDEGL